MKRGFFLKLARSNISKNRRFFLPRILSEAGLLCVFYIVFTLRTDERILQLRGGQYIEVFMSIGVAVMSLKKKAVLQNALLLEESGIENQSRYRTKTIPAAGAILKEEDSQEKQATFEI